MCIRDRHVGWLESVGGVEKITKISALYATSMARLPQFVGGLRAVLDAAAADSTDVGAELRRLCTQVPAHPRQAVPLLDLGSALASFEARAGNPGSAAKIAEMEKKLNQKTEDRRPQSARSSLAESVSGIRRGRVRSKDDCAKPLRRTNVSKYRSPVEVRGAQHDKVSSMAARRQTHAHPTEDRSRLGSRIAARAQARVQPKHIDDRAKPTHTPRAQAAAQHSADMLRVRELKRRLRNVGSKVDSTHKPRPTPRGSDSDKIASQSRATSKASQVARGGVRPGGKVKVAAAVAPGSPVSKAKPVDVSHVKSQIASQVKRMRGQLRTNAEQAKKSDDFQVEVLVTPRNSSSSPMRQCSSPAMAVQSNAAAPECNPELNTENIDPGSLECLRQRCEEQLGMQLFGQVYQVLQDHPCDELGEALHLLKVEQAAAVLPELLRLVECERLVYGC
eukprot:TRINITY_DN45050_c0_g1_i2.p1 TRINITY_DN45050_c0_g1~~TRINITY_DN45050_c0_g1_i2.p1  ORF type:complete len:448 (+),score=76.15 TRINITY_DN45050_c0_g1_i2:72-1415(+)